MAKNPVKHIFYRVFLCLFISTTAVSVHAASPLKTHNLNPLTLIYGLPLGSAAQISQQTGFDASLNISNTINTETTSSEYLFIDGETTELNMIYHQPVTADMSLRIIIPFIRHDAGSLDGFIDDFHDAFGFPEGARPDYPTNQFLFQYQRNSTTLVELNRPTNGLGDIRLEAGYQLYQTPTQAGAIWTSLKLPTGDSDELNGSGHVDIALWYAAETLFVPGWSRYYNFGLLLPGRSDVLTSIQKDEVFFGMAGIEWQVNPTIVLNVQLDFHTAFYDSQTKFLGNSVQISSGGHIRLSKQSQIDIVVVEDIQIGASPDVTFQLGYSQRF